jgi:hypothetical protein
MSVLLRSLLLIVSAVAAAQATVVRAADWPYREPLNHAPVSPTGFVPAPGGGLWTYDLQSVRFTDAAGRTHTVMRSLATEGGISGDVFTDGYVTRDGGVVLSAGCTLQRIEPDLRATWRHNRSCRAEGVNADGIVWIDADENLLQFGPDGVNRHTVAFDRAERIEAIAALADGGALVLSRRLLEQQVTVSRFDAQAQRRWRWTGAEALNHALLPSADGGAVVFGMAGANLVVARLDARGNLIDTRAETVHDGLLLGARQAPSGAFIVVSGAQAGGVDRPQNLYYVTPAGRVVWGRAVCPQVPLAAQRHGMPELAIDDDDTVSNACPPVATAARGSRLLRRDRDGREEVVSLPFAHSVQLRRERDRQLLLLARPTSASPLGAQLFRIDRDGNSSLTVIDGLTDTAPRDLLAAANGSDGSRYVLSQDSPLYDVRTDQVLTKLYPGGAVAWRTPIASFAVREASLSAGHGRVCVAELADITATNRYPVGRATCLLDSDGSVISQSETALGQFGRVRSRPVQGGKMVHVTTFSDHYTLRVDQPDGTPEGTSYFGEAAGDVAIDGQGRATVIGAGKVRQYDIARRQVYAVPLQLDIWRLSLIGTADDGSAYLHGTLPGQPGVTRLWALAPDGSTRWLVPIENGAVRANALVVADDIHLMQTLVYPFSQSEGTVLRRIRRTDGAELWRSDSINPGQGAQRDSPPGGLALTAGGDALVLAHTWGDRLRLEHIDRFTGVRTREYFADCGRYCTRPTALALDAAGNASLATTLAAADGDQGAAVLSIPGFGDTRGEWSPVRRPADAGVR